VEKEMRYTIFDIETDGLLDSLTRLHCLVAHTYEDNQILAETVITNPWELANFLSCQSLLVGHNVKRYDFPAIQRLTGYKHKGQVIDTLALSWYLYPNEAEHGLEVWGERVGVAKPVITDWENLDTDDYINRCRTDVVINSIILGNFINHLKEIYQNEDYYRLMAYLTWKLDCAAEQEANPLTIDRAYCKETLEKLNTLVDEKKANLAIAMPRVEKWSSKKKPSKMFTVKGELTKAGIAWLELLSDNDLEADFDGEIQILKTIEDPNPTSTTQLKSWLFSLGWQPTVFNYVKDGDATRAVPQIQDKDKKLCPNIIVLAETHPVLENLKGLFMLQHRIGVLNGFLECSNEQGKMPAQIAGFTNTLRFKHKKPVANLPSVDKPYGKEIRGAIIAPDDNHLFCGSDMSSLEDTTKQHYMYFYDPEYVKAMRVPGFDPHLDIAVLSGMLTNEQVADHKLYETTQGKEGTSYKKIRTKAKVVNFSGIYGAGPPKIALTTGMSLEEASLLHKIYWDRNKSVKEVTNDTVYKTVRDQMWLYNPVSGFWYSLRQPKDRFSTLNQGTGVYCFDTHIRNVREQGIIINLQYHDEIGFGFLKEQEQEIKDKLNKAIELTNKALSLNVPLGISIDIGKNYAEAH
jgi:DNA polymerase I-like protein with 3'-5' exonuclease and polymerase domains